MPSPAGPWPPTPSGCGYVLVGIDHATLQVEPSGSDACQGTAW